MTTPVDSGLLPCPHCGGPVEFHHEEGGCDGCHNVWCPACESLTDFCGARDGETLEELRASVAPLWNKRLPATAGERQVALANKLWTMCVQDGWPWAEGSIQDSLTELGLLYAKDMTAEESGPECTNCEGDCKTCYRAVTRIEDAAMEKANG